ncbi:MAG: class I SAM-dependent methyltransferase [Patescibacteria group bacterium]
MFSFTKSYQDKMAAEISHYENVFKNSLCQAVPPSWHYVEKYFSRRIKKATAVNNLYQYVSRFAQGKKHLDILGLGSGACGPELEGIIPELKKQKSKVHLSCLDINRQALNTARKEAKKRKIDFTALIRDINFFSFPQNKYDIIVAHASLHHFDKLDHVIQGVNQALKPDGIFITVDIPTKNGYLMWPETYQYVSDIWKILPPKYKIDHTKHAKPVFAPKYENVDYSKTSFECANSEKVLPTLRRYLREIVFVPGMSISRRFFDTKFGPNYNLKNPIDKSIMDFILNLDNYLLDQNILKPETFFGVYRKI